MANMNYCKFNNTLIDLDDCLSDLSGGCFPSSNSEKTACHNLIATMIDFLVNEGIIEETDELNESFEEFCNQFED